jgi:DNA-binding IclR family transcriptional regulator
MSGVVESVSMNASQPAMMGLDSVEPLFGDHSALNKCDLAEVRTRGWASGMGGRDPGVGSVAAPIRRRELFVITVFGPELRLQGADGEKLGRLLLGVVQDLKAS